MQRKMKDGEIRIAILLTCHNRREKTIKCLYALYNAYWAQNLIFEVFLVDDASSDGTADAIAEKYPEVNVIAGNGNLFWNRGMHLAWETAAQKGDFDYYLWLNDDTIILENAIQELMECAVERPGALICGAIRSEESESFTYGGRDMTNNEVIPNGRIQNSYTINGNCVLVSKEIHDKVGKLDPIFPHAIGDYEYGLRVLKAGFGVISTRYYIGYCERNAALPKWCYAKYSLKERVKALYSPLGNSHPYYFFIFESRHIGIVTAIKHFLSIHLRVLIPQLWK